MLIGNSIKAQASLLIALFRILREFIRLNCILRLNLYMSKFESIFYISASRVKKHK